MILVLSASACDAVAETCSSALSTVLAAALEPELARLDVCKDLKLTVATEIVHMTVGIDKVDRIELRALRYCPTEPASHVDAAVYVRCKTSDKAVIKTAIDETFDLSMTVRNDTCEIGQFNVIPHGEIGREVAKLASFSNRMKQAAAQPIQALCKQR